MNINIRWVRQDKSAWLNQHLNGNLFEPEETVYSTLIERLADETNNLGPQPLWDGYADNNRGGPTRMPNVVRTDRTTGNYYTYLVQCLQPEIVVEFGTAFGVSGMYFLAGLESNKKGKLLTFEPNDVWRKLAIGNMSQISNRFISVAGTFEDNIDSVLSKDQKIGLAFIDAIHTKEFVLPQLEIVISRCDSNAIIILDDINFSENMKECWGEVSNDDRFSCGAELGNRIGILQLR